MRTLSAVLALSALGGPEPRAQELKELSLEQLLSLEVRTASLFPQPLAEAPAALFVLTERDIRVLGATSVADLLRTVPGLDVMTAWDSEVEAGARGLSAFQNAKLLVLLDGHRVNNDFSGGVRWKEVPVFLEDIERVEVSLSPISALYGANAFSGIVQIFTKPARRRWGWRLGAQTGNKRHEEYAAAYGGALGKLDFALSAGAGKTEGWGNRSPRDVREPVLPVASTLPGETAKLKDWSRLARLDLRADYPAAEGRRLGLRAGAVLGEVATPNLLTGAGKAADNPVATSNGYAGVEYARGLAERSGAEARFASSYWRDEGGGQPYATRRHDGDVRVWSRLGERLRLTAGLAGETVRGESSYLARPRVGDDLYGGYGQLELRPREGLDLTGGLRYDKHTDMDGVVSPRGAVVLALADGHHLRYGAGTAFRKASFLETHARQADGANPASSGLILGQLEYPGGRRLPERITYHDLGYQGLLGERLSLRLGLFRHEIKDLIVLRKVQPFPPFLFSVRYENLQRLDILGGEAELRWAPSDDLQAFGNVSYQDLDYGSPIDTQRLSVPRIKWNLGLVGETSSGVAGSLVVRHVGGKKAQFGHPAPDGAVHFMEIRPYTALDLKLTYSARFGAGTLELGLTVLNALDEKHMEFPIFDGRPGYFGFDADPARNLDDGQRRAFENRNALNDRRMLAHLSWRY